MSMIFLAMLKLNKFIQSMNQQTSQQRYQLIDWNGSGRPFQYNDIPFPGQEFSS